MYYCHYLDAHGEDLNTLYEAALRHVSPDESGLDYEIANDEGQVVGILNLWGYQPMRFINLTPHALTVLDARGLTALALPAPATPGDVLRCAEVRIPDELAAIVPTFKVSYGAVTRADGGAELPPVMPGVGYIVSALVRLASVRKDFFSPGELKRNDAGQPIGCIGLSSN